MSRSPKVSDLFTKPPRAHAISARFVSLLLSLATALPGCSETRAVELNVCGNRVVEAGEDCDGEVGCDATCHYACSKDQACPSGFRCDVEAKTCRTASGSFQSVSLGETSFGTPIAADLDGDHRDDLLLAGFSQSTTSSVSFFGRDRQIQTSVRLPAAVAASARNVALDELPQFILSGQTIMAFQSKVTRRPSPLIGATREVEPHARLFLGDIGCNGPQLLLLEHRELSSLSQEGELMPVATTNVSGEELDALEAGRPFGTLDAVGSYAPTLTSSCDLLALSSADGTRIDLYGSPDSGDVHVVSSVTLTGTAQRLFFVDWNQDGAQDLYIVGSLQSEIAYGVGDGRFHSDPTTLPMRGVGAADGRTSDPGETKLLAVANDSDGLVKFYGGDDPPDGEGPDPSAFADAFALDLTGDGRKDIAAVTRSRNLYVQRTHPAGHSSPVTLRTPGVPELFGAADFDGDGHDDLLLAESATAEEPPNVVSVLFAPMTFETTSPTELAEVPGIRQLLGGYLPWLDIDSNAAMSALYTGEDGALKLGYLSSGADRLLRSEVRSPIQDVYSELGVLGSFSEGVSMELAVLTQAVPFELESPMAAMSVALHTIGANGTRFERSLPLEAELAPVPLSLLAAADRDGDGRDELYLTTARGLAMLQLGEADLQLETVVTSSSVSGVRTQDVNDDGRADIVAFDAANNAVWVLMAGTTSFGKVHQLSLSPDICRDFVNAATFVHLDQDGERELVVNCNVAQGIEDLVQFDILNSPLYGNLTAFDIDWSSDRVGPPRDLDVLTSVTLTTGDFNGDGVEDIAGDGADVRVLFGVPRE